MTLFCKHIYKVIILSLIFPACSIAQQLSFENYSLKEGLINNEVQCLFQDSRGYIWIGTTDGVSRFDGLEFSNYFLEDSIQGVPVSYVNTISEDSRNTIWMGLQFFEGAIHFQQDKEIFGAVEYPVKTENSPPVPANYILTVFHDLENRIWIGTNRGLYRYKDEEYIFVPIDTSGKAQYITSIYEDRCGDFWIAAESGVYRLRTGPEPSVFRLDETVLADPLVIKGRREFLWIGTKTNGLVQIAYTDSGYELIRRYAPSDGLPREPVNDILIGNSGELWLATWQGLGRLNPQNGDITVYTTANGLPSSQINDLMLDHEENIWIGTTIGISKLRKVFFINYNRSSGLPFSYVNKIRKAPDGRLWFLGWTGVFYQNGDRFTEINFFRNTRMGCIHFHKNGEIWFGTEKGLYILEKSGKIRESVLFEELRGGWVFDIFRDSWGQLWLGCPFGAMRYSKGTKKYYFGTQERPSVTHITEDRNRAVWFGTYRDGLYCLPYGSDDADWTKSDLPVSQRIRSLLCDSNNNLWIGTRLQGVFHYSIPNKTLTQYTKSSGLMSNFVQGIWEDSKDNLWFCTKNGVSLYTDDGFHSFSTENGLIGDGVFDCREDQAGDIWFAAFNGISRFTPPLSFTDDPPPFINIDNIEVDDNTYPGVDPLRLTASQNSVGIEYTGICYSNTNKLRYRYRLLGLNDAWSADTRYRYVYYSNLAPGSYTFEVRAENSAGIQSVRTASVHFSIAKPFYRQWWFIGMEICAAAGLIYTAHRLRLNHLLQIERMRSEIATDLHDEVGTTLSSIAIFGEMVKREIRNTNDRAAEKIEEIIDISQKLVSTMRDIVWMIKPENDRLEDMILYMQQFTAELLEAREISFEFSIAESMGDIKIPMEKRHHIFMIFKESLHNMVRHSSCTSSHIILDYAGGELVMRIQDNGEGFSLPGTGNGLCNMQKRADRIQGTLEVHSKPGSGTEIRLAVAL